MLLKQEIPDKDLNLILENFDLGKIISIEPMLTSGNISYIIKTPTKKYLIRLCPDKGPRFRSVGEINAEIELLHYLKDKKFPVLIPIKDKSGKEIISFKNHNGYIREFFNQKYKENPSLEEIKEFGRVLGKFQNKKQKRAHL
jgi:Ser/Thr protein kinase RdoA (MazF antagonist)